MFSIHKSNTGLKQWNLYFRDTFLESADSKKECSVLKNKYEGVLNAYELRLGDSCSQ